MMRHPREMLMLWSDWCAEYAARGTEGVGLKHARDAQRPDSAPAGQQLHERFIAGVAAVRTDDAVLELVLSCAIPRRDV